MCTYHSSVATIIPVALQCNSVICNLFYDRLGSKRDDSLIRLVLGFRFVLALLAKQKSGNWQIAFWISSFLLEKLHRYDYDDDTIFPIAVCISWWMYFCSIRFSIWWFEEVFREMECNNILFSLEYYGFSLLNLYSVWLYFRHIKQYLA